MGFNTTDGKFYIVELYPPFNRLELQFMPENLTWSRNARLSNIAVVGRNNDLLQYTGGEDKLTFDIDFYSDEENRRDVMRKVNFLKSLAMSDGGFGAARNFKIVMGKFFTTEVWSMNSVVSTYSNYHQLYDYLPVRASVKLTMTLDPKYNRRIRDVRKR